MTKINFKFVNGSTVVERTIEIQTTKKVALNTLVGTVCSELFHKVDRQKQGVYKLFKMNEPFDIIMSSNGIKVDTFKIDKLERTKLKLNSTIERKQKFAKVVFALSEDLLRKVELVDVATLINPVK
jgi:hypothetical protein